MKIIIVIYFTNFVEKGFLKALSPELIGALARFFFESRQWLYPHPHSAFPMFIIPWTCNNTRKLLVFVFPGHGTVTAKRDVKKISHEEQVRQVFPMWTPKVVNGLSHQKKTKIKPPQRLPSAR